MKANLVESKSARDLIQEADELTAIFVALRETAQRRKSERERLEEQMRDERRHRRRT